jgi:hypothetical protein
VSRASIPASVLKIYEKSYPLGWLGVLSEITGPSIEKSIAPLRSFVAEKKTKPHRAKSWRWGYSNGRTKARVPSRLRALTPGLRLR